MEYNGFKIVKENPFTHFQIKQLGSGAVPEALGGLYTSLEMAKRAIDAYEPRRGAKKHVKANTATDV